MSRTVWTLVLFAALASVGCGESLPPVKTTADLQNDLQSTEVDVRRAAVENLAKMGPGAEDALDALFTTLEKDTDLKVRRGAAHAIGQVAVTQPQITDRLDRMASAERDGEVKAALFQASDSIREARKITKDN